MLTQIDNATIRVRELFKNSVGSVFPTPGGCGIGITNRTLDAKTMRSLDRITKNYGCTYCIAPAVGKQQTGFAITIYSEV